MDIWPIMIKRIIYTVIFLCSLYFQGQGKPPVFQYRIAILGNPAYPDTRYDKTQMAALKKLGFNAVQLNIAWGARPAEEPLNLEDILYVQGKSKGSYERVQERLIAIRQRAQTAKKWGFRTTFHFGAPNIDSLYHLLRPDLIDVATETNSITK